MNSFNKALVNASPMGVSTPQMIAKKPAVTKAKIQPSITIPKPTNNYTGVTKQVSDYGKATNSAYKNTRTFK